MEILLYFYFIGLSFLASLSMAFRRDAPPYLRFFSLFLLATGIVELTASYLFVHRRNNIVMYNLFSVVEFLFYFFVLYQAIHNRKAKRIVFHISWIYLLLCSINMAFVQKIIAFHSMTYALGCLLIAAVSIYYFLELFQLEHSVNLAREPAFWICSGLLFYYACSFPIIAFSNFLNNLPGVILRNLATIVNLLNVFLYSAFTVAFLCTIRVRKSTS